MARFLRLRPIQLDLGDMLAQIVAVALGVVLGFAATSWSERAHQRDLLHATIGNIAAELSSNESGMALVMPAHAKSVAVYAALASGSEATAYMSREKARTVGGTGAFGMNVPLDVAWQIAQNDQGLTLLPYDDRYQLGWIYQLQRIYIQAEDRYRESLLTISAPPGGNYYFEIVDLENQEHAVVSAETQLSGLYKRAIDRLKRDE
jgi:hypothetical protein